MAIGFGSAAMARNVTVRLLGDVKDYNQAMGTAGYFTQELAEDISGLDEAIHRTFRRAGQTMMGLGLTMQAASAMWAREAVQWESAFTDVVKTVNATDVELTELGTTIRQMSARDLPMAAEGLAQLASLAGQLGVATEAIDEYTKTAAQLGIATELSAGQAIFSLSQFTNIMGEAEENVDELGSVLVELGNTTKTTEGAILDFSTRLAGAANVVGLTSAEVMGISAAFSSAGVESERGGTAVQKVLLSMNDAVTTGGSKLATFAHALGMTNEEFKTLFRQDPAEVFARFVESLTEAGDEANTILRRLELTDQRLVAAFLSVANAGEDVRSVMNRANEEMANSDALAQEAARYIDTVAQKFTLMRNAITESWRALGEGFIPIIKVFLDVMTMLINIFNSIPQPIKTTMGLLTGLGGTLLVIAGTVLTFSKAMEAAFHAKELAKVGFLARAIQGLTDGLRGYTATAITSEVATSRLYIGFNRFGVAIYGALAGIREFIQVKMASHLMEGGRAAQFLGRHLMAASISGKAFGASMGAAGMGMTSFMLSMGGMVPAILAIIAVGAGLIQLFRTLDTDTQTTTASVDALAESMGVTITNFSQLGEAVDDGTDSMRDFQVANQQLIADLRNVSSEVERLDKLTDLVFQLRLRGVSDEQIQEMVNRLVGEEGANIELTFFVDEVDFERKLQAVQGRLERNSLNLAEMLYTGGEFHELNQFLETQAQEAIELLGKKEPEAQAQGAKLIRAVLTGIQDNFGNTQAQELRANFARFVTRAGLGEEDLGEGFLEGIGQTFDVLATGGERIDEAFAELFSAGHFGNLKAFVDEAEKLGIELGDGNLGEKFGNLIESGEDLDRVLARLESRTGGVSAALADQPSLIEILGTRYDELGEAAKNAYARDVIGQLEAQRGAEATLQVLEEWRASVQGTEEEYGELGRIVIAEMDRIRRETGRTAEQMFVTLNRSLDQLEALQQREADTRAQHHERMGDLEEQRIQSMRDARSQLDDQLRDINETYRDRLKQRADDLTRWAGLTERVWSEHTLSLSSIIANTQMQGEMFDAWRSGLDELRRRGMSDMAIEQLGLSESPRALSQIRRILEGTGDQILELNELVEKRAGEATKVVERESTDLADELAKSRADAVSQYDQAISDINARFNEQMGELNKSVADELADIQKQMGEVGASSARDWTEAVAQGLASGNEHIAAQARELERIMADTTSNVNESLESTVLKLKNIEDTSENAFGTLTKGFESFIDISSEANNEDSMWGALLWSQGLQGMLADLGGDGGMAGGGGGILTGGGGLTNPVPGGSYTNDWGYPRSGGRTHQGTDIFAKEGTPIFSPASGMVHETMYGFSGMSGNRLWVMGEDGQAYFFAHLASLIAEPGQMVERGSLLGTVGDTGNAKGTPPHLHFGIKRNGTWVNPYHFLQGGSAFEAEPNAQATTSTNEGTTSDPGPNTSSGGGGGVYAFADGGIATKRTFGEFAEAGSAEAVIPLNRQGVDFMAMAMRKFASPSGGGGGGAFGATAREVLGALADAGVVTGGEQNLYGPIEVRPVSVRDFEKQLQERARQRKLTRPSRGPL